MRSNKEEFEFDIKVPLEKRKEEVEKQLKNHPGKIPIIVQKSKTSKLVLPESFKFKFLVKFISINVVKLFLIEFKNKSYIRIVIHFVDKISFPTSLLFYTGSYIFNEYIKIIAYNYGYRLRPEGLFDKNNNRMIIKREKDIFKIFL